LLGDDHPFALACAANLALDLRAAGRDADQLAADTLARLTAVLGASHADVQQAALRHRLSFDFDPPAI
jgi:hypothetical protein